MSKYFTGRERLEHSPAFARNIRMGSPVELRVPDHQRVIDAINSANFQEASTYLELFHSQYQLMLSLVFEWVLQIPQSLSELVGGNLERELTEKTFQRFKASLPTINYSPDAAAGARQLASLLIDADLRPGLADSYREQAAKADITLLHNILRQLGQAYAELSAALEQHSPELAVQKFDAYRYFAIGVHDACIQFTQSCFESVQLDCEQEVCEKLIQQSFSSCSFFEPLWSVGQLPPDALAAFLAEHLRLHFSGDKTRGGGIEIIEDEEKYRLVFDACGSGGALRRRLDKNGQLPKLAKAGPATWNRANEVPAYCAHCAFNEMTAIDKYGYPILVTDFNPDPQKPCGWTVYKDPDAIPATYYERLGRTKPA